MTRLDSSQGRVLLAADAGEEMGVVVAAAVMGGAPGAPLPDYKKQWFDKRAIKNLRLSSTRRSLRRWV